MLRNFSKPQIRDINYSKNKSIRNYKDIIGPFFIHFYFFDLLMTGF